MNQPKKTPTLLIPRIAKGIVPTTAIASGLLSSPSLSAPGDLDPTFGDMGRVGSALNFHGPAWSAQALAGDETLIAGSKFCEGFYCNYYYQSYADGFMAEISPAGALDLEVAAAPLAETEVFDAALQPDNKVVAVGRASNESHSILTVFRLLPGGSLDANFADGGVMHYATDTAAQSVVLDPSGAIVVAGSNAGKLMVLRLLANGRLDASFGNGGVYIGPPSDNTRIHILRTGSGGYRIGATLSSLPHVGGSYCAVVALTAAGTLDTTFGASGIAARPPQQASASISCEALAAQSDGSLLLGGQDGGHGFVTRLLAAGAVDPSFAAGAVQSNMVEATALAVDAADSVLVAGASTPGVSGALILRLQANGLLDVAFGNAGLTWIDLPSNQTTGPTLNDMSVLADGRIMAVGGAWPTTSDAAQPLLVRLLGTDGTAGPGIIGATPFSLSVKEEEETAVVTVRRMGGATGAVSVAYKTADYTGTVAAAATAGADYAPVAGRLSWPDGDRSDRQITVPIVADGGQAEEPERFIVTLADAQGGAQIGTQDAVIEIAADGAPAGQFGFEVSNLSAREVDGQVQVVVDRNYYSTGPVTVTVTPVAGSATPADFAAAPIVLSWADGDSAPKTATIPIINDNDAESQETFTVELSNPTSGAVVGPHSHLAVTIYDEDQRSGGGGAFDGLSLLCLGCLRWLRSRLRGGGQET